MRHSRRKIVSSTLGAAFAACALLSGAPLAQAGPYGMGSGMMGPGMMGSPRGSAEAPQEAVDPVRADALLGYIHEHDPACLQCHAVSAASFGPSFASIAGNYTGEAGAEQRLAQHIAHGFGRMPSGLASDAQAAQLARLILELPEAGRR